jgi:hypothetical protein
MVMSRARDLADLGGAADAGTVTGESLIINGDMAVSQRGSVAAIQTAYTACDRFKIGGNGTAARFDSSQSTDVPSGQGFSNSLKLDVSTADTSISAGDFAILYQVIEAQNLQHLKYGTSEAEKCTLSFWVKSPKTGTHNLEIQHSDAGYFNTHQYSITTANTWQKVEITFDGYQTTAINNDNGQGFVISWWLVAGSTFSGGTYTENTWYTTNANRAVGQVNIADSTSNDFYLTGVKLEVGSAATPFQHESYGDNLAKCQRYYNKHSGSMNIHGFYYNSSTSLAEMNFPVTMRSAPTLSATNGAGSTSSDITSVTGFTRAYSDATDNYITSYTADAEL